MSASVEPVLPEILGWIAKVAEAVKAVGDLKLSYGDYYVTQVKFGFDDITVEDFDLTMMDDYSQLMVRFGDEVSK